MNFQDFIRTIPLVHRHIIRTRQLTYHNQKFRVFLEQHNIDPNSILSSTVPTKKKPVFDPALEANASMKNSLVSMETAQKKIEHLEMHLLLLQIDNDTLIKKLASIDA